MLSLGMEWCAMLLSASEFTGKNAWICTYETNFLIKEYDKWVIPFLYANNQKDFWKYVTGIGEYKNTLTAMDENNEVKKDGVCLCEIDNKNWFVTTSKCVFYLQFI